MTDAVAAPPPQDVPPGSKSLQDTILRRSTGAWFETSGSILDKERKRVTWPKLRLNSMQAKVNAVVKMCRERMIPCRIITLKGRQQGSSTYTVAEAYHMMRSREVKCCIIGDEYEKSVANLVAMHDYYYQHDRFDWGNKYHRPSGKYSHGSQLVTETANDPRAGASGTLQVVIATEVAHWKETGVTSGKATFAALLNCVPQEPDTLVIVESTPNGVGGVYYNTYQGAITMEDYLAGRIPSNWNGFFKVFYPWHQHPEYQRPVTDEEREEIEQSLSEREMEFRRMGISHERLKWRRIKLVDPAFDGDEALFEQEYPADEESCFLTSGRRLFPLQQVQALRRACMGAEGLRVEYGVLEWTNSSQIKVKFRPTSEDEAWIKVWERPKPGFRYIVPIDPCTGASQQEGKDPDNHGLGVMRAGLMGDDATWHPNALVARATDCWAEKRDKGMAVCRWDIEIAEERAVMMAKWYGNCPIVPEMNMDRGFVELMKRRGNVNIYQRQEFNRIEQRYTGHYGWKTTNQNRSLTLEALVRDVRIWNEPGRGIRIWDPAVIEELAGMIVKANGRAEAMVGMHDDQVFMLAIGLDCIESATTMPYERRAPADGGWDDRPQIDYTFS